MRRGIAAAAAALLVVAVWRFPSFIGAEPACGEPCRDWSRCAPLTLAMSVKPLRAPAGKTATIWYRVELANRSCLIADLDARAFMQEEASPYKRGFLFRLKGPADATPREFTPQPAQRGDVTLYRPDSVAQQALMDSGRLDANWRAKLRPGESIAAVPDVLSPYREFPMEVRTQDGGKGTADARADVAVPPGVEAPPAGYRAVVIPSQLLDKPGRYELTVVARSLGAFGSPMYPRWQALKDRLPVGVVRLLHQAGLAPKEVLSDGPGWLASPPVELEVVR